MSGTSNNVANFYPVRPILATWFLVCRHTFVSWFPDIDVTQKDDNRVSFLLIPTSNVDLHNRPPPTKHKKLSAAFIPSCHVFFTSCCIVASHRTGFVCLVVCLFVCLFGWLLRCLSAPCCCFLSHCLATPRRCAALRLLLSLLSHHRWVVALSRRCIVPSLHPRVLALSRPCVSSCLVVVSVP